VPSFIYLRLNLNVLHAMEQEQRSGLDLDGFYLDLQSTGVPVSAHKSVCDGCPLGCPPVSDHILPARAPQMRHGSSQPPPNDPDGRPGPRPGQRLTTSAPGPWLPVRSRSPVLSAHAEMRMSSLYKAYDAPLLPDDYPSYM
jgi:hypothetical protein